MLFWSVLSSSFLDVKSILYFVTYVKAFFILNVRISSLIK